MGPLIKEDTDLSALNKKLLIILGCVVGGLLLIYVGVSLFFMDRFLFNTTINGRNVFGMTADQVQRREADEVSAYELTLTTRDGETYTLTGRDFSLEKLYTDDMDALARGQNGFAWIGSLFHDTDFRMEGTIDYDADQLTDCIREMDFMAPENQTPPSDASISEYIEGSGYVLIPSEEGTQINEERFWERLKSAVVSLRQDIDLLEEGCYDEPLVLDDDETLLTALSDMNTFVSAQITFTVGSDRRVLDGSIIHDWIIVGDDGTASLDTDRVSEYVSSLSSAYNTASSSKTLATSYGSTVQISSNIHYGWKVDAEAEKAKIISEIKAGETVSRDLNYSMTANSHGSNDYGDSYVEINLTAQHLFLHKNGSVIMDSDVVTGLASKANRVTPTGAFTVTYKQRGATLRGEDYESYVDYWMPFYGDYGMHDASWRSSFGGTIYKTNGSHGCVNMPPAKAKILYENIDKGWPVLIYTLQGTESGASEAKAEAKKTDELISAIGSPVTLSDESAIAAARTSYNALSSQAKEYVTGYGTLTAAESALETLKSAADAADAADAVDEE